jgi:hypothetical protein
MSPQEVDYRYAGLTSILDLGMDFWWYDCHWSNVLPGVADALGNEVREKKSEEERASVCFAGPLALAGVDSVRLLLAATVGLRGVGSDHLPGHRETVSIAVWLFFPAGCSFCFRSCSWAALGTTRRSARAVSRCCLAASFPTTLQTTGPRCVRVCLLIT